MATIERYLVHVGWAYRMAGLGDLSAAPLVKFEMKAARRELGVRQRQPRAIRFKGDISDLDSPARGVCLAHLHKACRRDAFGLRDAALLRVAYDTGARRSELAAVDVAHIDGLDGDGAGIGWRLREDASGMGFVREAALAARDHAFASSGAPHLIALTVAENSASWGLMRRPGMHRRPDLDFASTDFGTDTIIAYLLDRAEWEGAHG